MLDRPSEFHSDDEPLPPGVFLADELESRGMTQADLARRMKRPKKTINEIINGTAEITPDTAIQLERVLGVPARTWGSMERGYRELRARAEEKEELKKHLAWAGQVPTKQLMKLGWIPKTTDKAAQLGHLLDFYGIASPDAYTTVVESETALLRTSPTFAAQESAVVAWLRQSVRVAQRFTLHVPAFNEGRFVEKLREARGLTIERDAGEFFPALQRSCAAAGVVVLFVDAVAGAPVSGAARWLTPTKALIVLSGRYKSSDHFWFSFFHEAGHILKHGKREVSVDAFKRKGKDLREEEADAFARDMLIPSEPFKRFVAKRDYSAAAIQAFAEQVGIAAGVVVGRLQHDIELPWAHVFNKSIKLPLDVEALQQLTRATLGTS